MRKARQRAIRKRKSFKRRHGSRAFCSGHILDTKQTNRNAELPGRQLLDPHDFAQVFQIETSEGGDHVQLNAELIRISLRCKVETAAAEIPHAANFLEMPALRVGRLHVDKPIDLHARLATPLEPA